MSILSFCLMLLVFVAAAQSDKDIWPADSEAIVGSDVVLRCVSFNERPTAWHHVPIGSSMVEISHQDGICMNGYCERYSMVNNTPGEYSLRIRNVSIDDAGTHRCVFTKFNEQRGVELIVIVTYPSSETCFAEIPKDGVIGHNQCQLEPDRIRLYCSLRYVGNVKTFLEWTSSATSAIGFKISNTTSSGTMTSTLTLEDGHLQEATFLCRIRHLNTNLTSTFKWEFHIKTVPLRLKIATVDSDPQQIACASGLPYECFYSWKYDGQEIYSSQVLSLTGRKHGKYTCRATCDVRGKSCTYLSDEVTYELADNKSPSPEENKTRLIVGIVVPIAIVIGVVIFVIVLFRKRILTRCSRTPPAVRNHQKDQNENPSAETPVQLAQRDHQNESEEMNNLLKKNDDEEGNAVANVPIVCLDNQIDAGDLQIIRLPSEFKIKLRDGSVELHQ